MVDEPALGARLRSALTPYVEAGTVPGGALCLVRDGDVEAELCVGTLDGERPWQPDTLVMCFSVAKPVAALATLSVVAEGRLGLDQRVADVWPEFAAAGKEATTVRHLLTHSSGLYAFPEAAASLGPDDTDALVALLAEAPPLHPPGTAFGEHAATYGHLLGEVVRRAAEESLEDRWARLASEAGWDLHLRVSEDDEGRVATVVPVVDDWPIRYLDNPRWAPALGRPPGLVDPRLLNSRRWRTTPFAAINLHASARGIAAFHHDLLRDDGFTAGLLGPQLFAEWTSPQVSGTDLVLDREVTWTLGHQLDGDEISMGGAGGCVGWASRTSSYGAGWVTRGLGAWEPLDAIDEVLATGS